MAIIGFIFLFGVGLIVSLSGIFILHSWNSFGRGHASDRNSGLLALAVGVSILVATVLNAPFSVSFDTAAADLLHFNAMT